MDLCARPGPHQAPICPCRRTLSAFFVLPQVLLSPRRYDIGPFRSPAGSAVAAPVRYRPFSFSRRSCCPCTDTISALFVLPQVLLSLRRYAIGPFRSPAGPAVPAQIRYRPFSFFRRSWRGVAGGHRGGRARSRTSGGGVAFVQRLDG